MSWALLFGIACAVRGTAEPVVRVERYLVRISAEFSAEGVVPEEIRDALGPKAAVLELRLSKEPAREFRDASIGSLIRIEAASLTVTEPGEESRSVPLELVGRVVELRTFEDGEILDAGWAERTAGAGRHLDVFDLVFPAVSLAAPGLRDEETARRRIIWPTPIGRTARWDHAVDAIWTNNGREMHGDQAVWSIEYAGPWRLAGRTRAGVPRRRFVAQGEASGVALFGTRGEGLLHHSFRWRRTVIVEGAAGRLAQNQVFEGRVERQP